MKKEEQIEVAYEAPTVEVIEVEVEKGFTTSISGGAFGDDDGTVITPPMS